MGVEMGSTAKGLRNGSISARHWSGHFGSARHCRPCLEWGFGGTRCRQLEDKRGDDALEPRTAALSLTQHLLEHWQRLSCGTRI
jgi:hypothetical protein